MEHVFSLRAHLKHLSGISNHAQTYCRRSDDGSGFSTATKRPVDMNTWILELPRTVPVSLLRALHRHIQLLPVGVVSEVTASWPPDGGSCLARKLRPGHCQVTPTAQHLPARHIFPVCALGLKTSITACCCRPVVHQYHKAHSVEKRWNGGSDFCRTDSDLQSG